jgi:hypothetical protein
VVQIIGSIAVAVEADITSLDALGVDQLTFVRLGVVHILTDAKPGGIVNVVVEQGLDVCDKIRIVGDLYDHVKINLGLFMIMPD